MSDRRHLTLFAVCLVLAAGGGVCLAVARRGAGASGHLAVLARETDRGEVLDRRWEPVPVVDAGKREVVAEPAAGRLTLREATRRFRALHALQPHGLSHVLRVYPAASDEESLSRNVLAWAEASLPPGPGVVSALARLRGEYRERFGHDPGP